MVSLSKHEVGYQDHATTSSFDRLRMRSTGHSMLFYSRKPFSVSQSTATACADSPPTWMRPLSSCSVVMSSSAKSGSSVELKRRSARLDETQSGGDK
jgi:hypothetical protein